MLAAGTPGDDLLALLLCAGLVPLLLGRLRVALIPRYTRMRRNRVVERALVGRVNRMCGEYRFGIH